MHKLLCLILAVTGCAAQPAANTSSPNQARHTTEQTPPLSDLFTGAEQYDTFNRIAELVPTSKLSASTKPYEFPEGEPVKLPESFVYKGQTVLTEQFLQETDTSAVLVLHDGQIRHESYRLTGGRTVNWLSMSVAKSFTSALLGIAVAEGHITSIEEPVTKYVPGLISTAYDGVRIKDILQMSSGARWNEDYGDPESDISRLGAAMGPGGSLKDFLKTIVREVAPGTRNLYNSADTQALGQLLVEATGRSITDYMQEKLWQPLGMESPAYWMNDGQGMEVTFAGLNATARDYAKLGELYRNRGRWGDVQIVPAAWIDASIVADAPHLTVEASSFGMGYGYQWWLLDNNGEEYSAIGVYNQFIYVNPKQKLVVVKLSANSNYALTKDESSFRELESMAFFRSIGDGLTKAHLKTR